VKLFTLYQISVEKTIGFCYLLTKVKKNTTKILTEKSVKCYDIEKLVIPIIRPLEGRIGLKKIILYVLFGGCRDVVKYDGIKNLIRDQYKGRERFVKNEGGTVSC